MRGIVEIQYKKFKASGFSQREKLNVGQLRVVCIQSLWKSWNKMCDNPAQMIAAFRNVGISLNIDGSEDEQMKFQGQERGLPKDINIG